MSEAASARLSAALRSCSARICAVTSSVTPSNQRIRPSASKRGAFWVRSHRSAPLCVFVNVGGISTGCRRAHTTCVTGPNHLGVVRKYVAQLVPEGLSLGALEDACALGVPDDELAHRVQLHALDEDSHGQVQENGVEEAVGLFQSLLGRAELLHRPGQVGNLALGSEARLDQARQRLETLNLVVRQLSWNRIGHAKGADGEPLVARHQRHPGVEANVTSDDQRIARESGICGCVLDRADLFGAHNRVRAEREVPRCFGRIRTVPGDEPLAALVDQTDEPDRGARHHRRESGKVVESRIGGRIEQTHPPKASQALHLHRRNGCGPHVTEDGTLASPL